MIEITEFYDDASGARTYAAKGWLDRAEFARQVSDQDNTYDAREIVYAFARWERHGKTHYCQFDVEPGRGAFKVTILMLC